MLRQGFYILAILATLAQAGNLVQELQQRGRFNTFLELAETAGVLKILGGFGNYTVFAPTDEAFARRAAERRNGSGQEETPEELKKLVLYHVVGGLVPSSRLEDEGNLNTLAGTSVRVNLYYERVFSTFNQEGKYKVQLCNSIVNVVSLTESPLATSIFNIVSTINGARIEKTDIEASNGYIHTMKDTVDPAPTETLDNLIKADPRLSTFASLLTESGAMELLSLPGPYTVFAPTNAAMAQISTTELEALLAKPSALLKLVGHHIVPMTWFKAGMVTGASSKTLAGSEEEDSLNFTKGLTGNAIVTSSSANATVIQPDIQATNGVLNVIDTVL